MIIGLLIDDLRTSKDHIRFLINVITSDYDRTINWKDDYLNIKWPKKNPIISNKDSSNALDFKEYYKSYFNKR